MTAQGPSSKRSNAFMLQTAFALQTVKFSTLQMRVDGTVSRAHKQLL